jgi:hypothetical protein
MAFLDQELIVVYRNRDATVYRVPAPPDQP